MRQAKKRRIIRAADLFCGAGGTSTGLMEALALCDADVELLAVNHWAVAIQTHEANHKEARHLCQTLDTIDPQKAVPSGRLNLLVASPECFPAGTLILTSKGYEPIEKLKAGDLVLTHKNRWRKITGVMTACKDTVIVTGQGHPGIETTSEHPFYTRRRRLLHRPIGGNYHRYEEPTWTSASEFKGKLFWASPSKIESLPVPKVGGRGFDLTTNLLWLVGLWLAEGTVRIRKTNSEITISCGNHEADKVEKQLSVFASEAKRAGHSELRWRRRKVRTATLFETGHAGLASWMVENFGKLAKGKRLPAWVYGLEDDEKTALLSGYLQGDGHLHRKDSNSPKQTCQTVSKALAYGIKTLASTLGFRTSVHHRKNISDMIEGRKVNVSDALGVQWTIHPQRNDSFDDGSHHWTRIRTVSIGHQNVEVFNISVEEDESYIVEGIVVHNCTHHSRARGGRPMSDQSRASAWLILNWLEKLYVENVLIENVKEFRDWGALGADGRPLKSKRGELFQQFISSLESLGYNVEHRVLNAADYGDATTRERLFIIARRGNRPITFPQPTHASSKAIAKAENQPSLFGNKKLQTWRSAREIIDWKLNGQSIFNRKKPLAPNTMARIYAGLRKFSGLPFILPNRHNNDDGTARLADAKSIEAPMPTLTATSSDYHLVEPYLVILRNNSDAKSLDEPVPTLCTARHVYLAEPYLVQLAHSTEGHERRTQSPDNPLPTITTVNSLAICEPYLVKYYAGSDASSIDEPVPTVTANYEHLGLVEPYLIEYHGNHKNKCDGEQRTRSLDDPLATVDTSNRFGVAEPFIVQFYHNGNAQSVDTPLGTITTKDKFGLCIPQIGAVLDIRFRMLQPHELAAAMSFPRSYSFAGTRENRVKQIGNAVPVKLAKALCSVFFEEKTVGQRTRKAA